MPNVSTVRAKVICSSPQAKLPVVSIGQSPSFAAASLTGVSRCATRLAHCAVVSIAAVELGVVSTAGLEDGALVATVELVGVDDRALPDEHAVNSMMIAPAAASARAAVLAAFDGRSKELAIGPPV
jgi:hypothetical protein